MNRAGATAKIKPTSTESIHADSFDLVCFSHLRWNFVYQRPHHLMSRCARERRLFYVEEPQLVHGPSRWELRRDSSGAWIAVPCLDLSASKELGRAEHAALIDRLFAEHGIRRFVAWYYTPMALAYTRQLAPQLVVYDCMDELAAFNGAPPAMQDYEAELFRRADLVFTGGLSLYEAKRAFHANVHPFPSSIDYAHFSAARSILVEPPDQAPIPRPRVGFFGVIDERFDFELIGAVADARPNWQIVLVGPVAKVDSTRLPRRPNVHYLGRKAYEQLPQYLAGWDAAILPFACNQTTRFISPTKTPEYLAGGVPVISTPIRDVVNPYAENGLVSIAAGAEEFVQAIEQAFAAAAERPAWLRRVDEFLKDNSWDQTWARMKALIESSLGEKQPVRAPKARRSRLSPLPAGISALRAAASPPPALRRNGGKVAFDFLIVGAGFAGSVLAERLARGFGLKVLLVDKRPHVGGNAWDRYDEAGVLIHQYGPHIFHTNSAEVFSYLSRFTDWRPYEHRVLASVDGQLLPIPINLDTVNRLYGLSLDSNGLEQFLDQLAEPKEHVRTSEEAVVSKVGRQLYEKFFRNYTRKQWGLDPSDLDASVAARVPVRFNRDDRYFTDTYQCMPRHGFNQMFANMLDHPGIKVLLNTDYREVVKLIPHRQMIYTGPIDEYFDFCYGRLPYRSLKFKFETLDEPFHQPVAVINYPNEHPYTRSTEFKHLTGQVHPKTSLVYEYPCSEGDPFYPIPRPENASLYQKYRALAEAEPRVHFAGRLATYRYYNMDQVTAQALTLLAKLSGKPRGRAEAAHTVSRFSVDVPCLPAYAPEGE